MIRKPLACDSFYLWSIPFSQKIFSGMCSLIEKKAIEIDDSYILHMSQKIIISTIVFFLVFTLEASFT